jgi:hypothetical protein
VKRKHPVAIILFPIISAIFLTILSYNVSSIVGPFVKPLDTKASNIINSTFKGILAVNKAPTIGPIYRLMNYNDPFIRFNLTGSDPDGNKIKYSLQNPWNMNISLNDPDGNVVTFYKKNNLPGKYNFTYTATDTHNQMSTNTIYITINFPYTSSSFLLSPDFSSLVNSIYIKPYVQDYRCNLLFYSPIFNKPGGYMAPGSGCLQIPPDISKLEFPNDGTILGHGTYVKFISLDKIGNIYISLNNGNVNNIQKYNNNLDFIQNIRCYGIFSSGIGIDNSN